MDLDQPLPLLGGLSPARFMQRHWQKKPLLVRQAIAGFKPPLARAELFALAAEEGVESRLISSGARGWQLRRGPLARRALPPTTRAGWTLLVQGVDLHDERAALFLLTLVMAKVRKKLSAQDETAFIEQLRHLPVAVNKVLELEDDIRAWAQRFADKHHALFLGRGRHYPIAMEGALKLKEISYIHAEAYPAGELKHGPLALVDADMPVISIAPNDQLLDKLKSNLKEVQARGGELYVFADEDSSIPETEGVHILRLPEHYGELSPILHVVPLQLLSYHAALVKGTDVDKPRNLAKSVTVE